MANVDDNSWNSMTYKSSNGTNGAVADYTFTIKSSVAFESLDILQI